MWVARDKDNSLWIYKNKPIKKEKQEEWVSSNDDDTRSFRDYDFKFFPDVKWEDEEPKELNIKL